MTQPRDPTTDPPCTLLVVDDQEEALLSTRLLLEREGYRVLTAESGEDALSIVRSEAPQLIILDYFMPRMNGERLVEEIRARDEDVQILLQTGYSGENPPLETLRTLDIQGYHNKLDGPEDLLLWVEAALKTAKHLRRVRDAERNEARVRTQLSRLSARLLHVQEEEGRRISRELHDHLGQLLTAIGMSVEWARSRCSEVVASRLEETIGLVTEAIEATRSLSRTLRPEFLETLGLEAALKEHVGELERRSGLTVRSIVRVRDAEIPGNMATNIYRIVQEALNNVVRHAQATEVVVEVTGGAQGCSASVADNGRGFDATRTPEPRSLGLIGMRERARLIGGTLQIRSRLGAGTSVSLKIPGGYKGDDS